MSSYYNCLNDPFEKGLYKYTFRNRCDEDHDLILDDGATRIFLNASGTKGNISNDVKNFLNYLITNKATDTLTADIDDAVESQRESEKGEVVYMELAEKYMDQRNIGRNEGISIGRSEGEILGSVETMREFNVPDIEIMDKIIKRYGLTHEKAQFYLSESIAKYNEKKD